MYDVGKSSRNYLDCFVMLVFDRKIISSHGEKHYWLGPVDLVVGVMNGHLSELPICQI